MKSNLLSRIILPSLGRTLSLAAVLAVGVVLSACKQESNVVGKGAVDPSGVYALVSVNGNKVPAKVAHDSVSMEVRSGSFTIHADGTCGTKTTFVPPSGAEVSREVSATYKQQGTTLNMQWKGAGTTTGTLEGNTFTMNNEGMIFVYQK
jgi:hypothetical protein